MYIVLLEGGVQHNAYGLTALSTILPLPGLRLKRPGIELTMLYITYVYIF